MPLETTTITIIELMLYDISSIYETGINYILGTFNCDKIVQYNNYEYISLYTGIIQAFH